MKHKYTTLITSDATKRRAFRKLQELYKHPTKPELLYDVILNPEYGTSALGADYINVINGLQFPNLMYTYMKGDDITQQVKELVDFVFAFPLYSEHLKKFELQREASYKQRHRIAFDEERALDLLMTFDYPRMMEQIGWAIRELGKDGKPIDFRILLDLTIMAHSIVTYVKFEELTPFGSINEVIANPQLDDLLAEIGRIAAQMKANR